MTAENMGHDDEMSLGELGKSGRGFFFPVGLQLQIEISGVSIKMSSVSVGYLAGSWLIIKYPSTGGFGSIASKLFKGNRITVRYVNDGDVFGFQSELLGVTTEPTRLLFIAYPTLIARRTLRSTRRIDCYLPADIESDRMKSDGAGSFIRDGVIVDISGSGCHFTAIKGSPDEALPEVRMNDTVVLRAQLPGMEERLALSGSTKNIQRDSQRISMGVQFNGIDEETKMKLFEFISAVEKFSWEK